MNSLSYPLEMYYVDYDFNEPSFEDKLLIVEEYKNYLNYCHKTKSKINKQNIAIKAMEYLLKKENTISYFQGVREILNLLITELKTPDELFESLFPDRESLVEIFKQQFLDACELLLIGQGSINSLNLEWDRLGLEWVKIHRKYNLINSLNNKLDTKEFEFNPQNVVLNLNKKDLETNGQNLLDFTNQTKFVGNDNNINFDIEEILTK